MCSDLECNSSVSCPSSGYSYCKFVCMYMCIMYVCMYVDGLQRFEGEGISLIISEPKSHSTKPRHVLEFKTKRSIFINSFKKRLTNTENPNLAFFVILFSASVPTNPNFVQRERERERDWMNDLYVKSLSFFF